MPVQEVIWTALPRGRTPGLLGVGDRLHLSVLASPRLGTDAPPAAAVPALRLADFPDFVDWPATVRQRLRLSLVLNDGSPLGATLTSQPDSKLWASLFPADTSVVPFRFDDLSTTPISSPPVPSAADALKGLWVLAASRFGERVPTVAELDEVLTEAGLRGGPGPAGGLPPPVPDPSAGPRPGGESNPGYPGIHLGLHAGVDLGLRLEVDVVIDILLGRAREAPGDDGSTSGPAVPPSPVERAVARPAHQGSREDVRAAVEGVVGAHARPAASPSGPPPEDELRKALDFHQLVSVLTQHPDLLRRLGLVVDLDVTLPPSLLGAARAERLRVEPSWAPQQPTVNHSPSTACILDDRRFLAAPRPEESDLRDGLLRLDDPSRFRIEQFDVDAGSQKVQRLVATVDAVLARLQRGETLGTPEEGGLPTLRAAGIVVVHEDTAFGDQPVQNTAGAALREKVAGAAALNQQLEQTKPAPGSPGSSEVGPLFADHLTAGYRVDVWDSGSDAWHSLCRRDATYRFVDGPAAGTEIKVPGGEGFVQRAASGVPGTALSVPAGLFTWEGWSLSAPRPGRVLGLGDGLVDGAGTGGSPIHVQVITTPTAGSLPRLRFGRWYRMRARAVDLAGNSLPLGGPPKNTPEASAAVLYSRLEPVPSPVVVLRALPRAGESVERLVVTSDPVAQPVPASAAERHVVPPKASQLLAEAHGAFDTQRGMRTDERGWALACREAGSLEDEEHPPVSSNGSTFTVRPEPVVAVPWLPDPVAHGALLVGLPDVAPDAFELGVNRIPFSGPWPNRAAFRLALMGIPEGQVRGKPALTQGADGRVLTVQLLPAEAVTVQLSSYVDAGPQLANLFLFGVWQWIEGAAPPNLQDLRDQAARGRNWLLMPPRPLVLVHAVQRPLRPPSFHDDWNVERSTFDATVASVSGHAGADERSTSQIDVTATWTDVVDDLAADGPQPKPVVREAHVGHIQVPEALEGGFDHVALELGDTRRHRVRCRAEATTRFREYFAAELERADLVRPAPSEAPVLTREFDLPATSRPPTPVVRYVVPTFAWTRSSARQGDLLFSSIRRGRGLRVFLDRPWYSSGEGELLGVVFAPGPAPADPRLRSVVTQWAADPLWRSPPTDGSVSPALFPGAVVEDGLTLEELPGGPTVSVAGYPVHYDADRQAWYADIELDLTAGAGGFDLRHFPFVRLALARYQPGALRTQDGRDCKLSRVVVTDFVQLTADRELKVRALPPRDGKARRWVLVRAPLPVRLGSGGAPSWIDAEVLRRRWDGDDLGWEREWRTRLDLIGTDLDGRAIWSGLVSFPPDGARRRLLVKELEAVHRALAVTDIKPSAVEQEYDGPVTVTGAGFQTGARLNVGIEAVRDVQVVNDREIKAWVSVDFHHGAGIREVTVFNPNGELASCPCFSVGPLPPLAITGVRPNPAKFTPGPGNLDKARVRVIVTGSGFRQGTQVSFQPPGLGHDGTVVLSDTEAYIDIHADFGTYNVSVHDPPRQGATFDDDFKVERDRLDPP